MIVYNPSSVLSILTEDTDNIFNMRFTPDCINSLSPDEIFVFGSNLAGHHMGGAARTAMERFGAQWGNGEGIQGQSYAIPTMQGGIETIRPYVDRFLDFAGVWDQNTFLVTRIGCGIAGFTPEDIAPLFDKAIDMYNVVLPKDFFDIIVARRKRLRIPLPVGLPGEYYKD